MSIVSLFDKSPSPSAARLRQWSVLEIADHDGELIHRAIGLLNDSETRVRITSAIEAYEGGKLLTESGSIYTLKGASASPEQAAEQGALRVLLLCGEASTEVTDRYRRGRS